MMFQNDESKAIGKLLSDQVLDIVWRLDTTLNIGKRFNVWRPNGSGNVLALTTFDWITWSF